MRIRRARHLLASIVLVTLAFAASPSADHAWGSYHWARTQNPFTLSTGDNVSPAWDMYLAEAIGDWNHSTVLQLTRVRGTTRPRQCRPAAGRIEVCNASYGNNGWLGIAQIWASGTHITQAVAKMNDTYFDTATYNTPAWRRLVMCQEIAHDFGLDHQDENFSNVNLGTCMDYTSRPEGGGREPSNEHPNAHDYEQIETIYAHTDSTTTVGAELPRGGRGLGEFVPETKNQWGRLVRTNRNNRVQVYELDLGRGQKIITHVFWADPDGDARGR